MMTLFIPLILAASTPTPSAAPATVRTLDAVTIEGEAAVPEVLFITSRDHPRHREDLGLPLRRTALAVARAVGLPHLIVIHQQPVPADPKEQ